MRWIFYFFVVWILYRLFKRSISPSKKRDSKRTYRAYEETKKPSSEVQLEEMKRCPTCGTYNPKSHSLESRGNYYCNLACKQKA